jgi:hypothetical protein
MLPAPDAPRRALRLPRVRPPRVQRHAAAAVRGGARGRRAADRGLPGRRALHADRQRGRRPRRRAARRHDLRRRDADDVRPRLRAGPLWRAAPDAAGALLRLRDDGAGGAPRRGRHRQDPRRAALGDPPGLLRQPHLPARPARRGHPALLRGRPDRLSCLRQAGAARRHHPRRRRRLRARLHRRRPRQVGRVAGQRRRRHRGLRVQAAHRRQTTPRSAPSTPRSRASAW